MISVDIEKEIQQENKIFFGFNLRQIICLAAALLCSVIFVFIFGPDFDLLMIPCFAVGLICFFFGWRKYDGLPMERVILRKVRDFVYHNDKRKYRTKNAYVPLMNAEYMRIKNIDMQNKHVVKAIKKEDKMKAKMKKKSKIKGIK